MSVDTGFLDRLRSRGEEVLTQVSAELSSNPRFMQAMAGAVRSKAKLEEAVGRVLKQMNVPSRGEWKRALARIDTLEREVAALKAKAHAKAKAKSKPKAKAKPNAKAGARPQTPARRAGAHKASGKAAE